MQCLSLLFLSGLIYGSGATVAEIGYGYLGCFIDQENPRSLQGFFKDFGSSLTPLQCIEFCKDKGYKFAGLQYGIQCFCGDETLPDGKKVSDKECNVKCSGDTSKFCGGNWRNTVYDTGLTLVIATFVVKDYEYLGCYKDQELRSLKGTSKDFGDNLTPIQCIEFCKENGYKYAGLQYSVQCFCGDESQPSDKKSPDKECSAKCSGDITKICGGGWRNSVYATGLTQEASVAEIGYEYMGCYKDQENPRLLQGFFKDFGDYLTPLQCVEFCKEIGYLHAGLQYRSQCFCGDQSLPEQKKLADEECTAKCSGDVSARCGGDWKNTVYATGLTQVSSVANIGYKYEGCYRDQNERILNSYMQDFGENLVPEECVTLCKRYGYRFAGLQYRSQCFCGDSDLIPRDKRPETECNHKCSGDVTKLCGGGFRNTVYSTGITGKAAVADTGYPYLGCYKDSNLKRRLTGDIKDFGNDNTPVRCVNYCTEKGYKYAGLQYSSQCFCGDHTPVAKDKVDDKQCASRCTGNSSFYCGAGWRNTVYDLQATDATVEQIGDQYLGCYNDLIDLRKLNGKLKNLGINANPKNCIDFCYSEGFSYAGLQSSENCFCGNADPMLTDKREENECNSRCLGDKSKICGGKFRNTIYKTNAPEDAQNKSPIAPCDLAVTTVSGKQTCKGQIIFFDDFNGTSTHLSDKWTHEVKIAGEPDSEFTIFEHDSIHSYIEDGKLKIKPTVLNDSFIQRGKLELYGCTGRVNLGECSHQARIYLILPPVVSARLNTRNSLNFRYGRIDIRAKLPKGDWLLPNIWLESKSNIYGPDYSSGRMLIAVSRGNENLTFEENDLSCKTLEMGIVMGVENNVRELSSEIKNTECWNNQFHIYSAIWTHNNITFYVDGIQTASMLKNSERKLSDVVGFSKDISALWSVGSDIAPFDSDFYITIGVSAGGVRNFPDGATNTGRVKPWRNSEPKRILNFWKERHNWEPTWLEASTLEVDYVKVTAI